MYIIKFSAQHLVHISWAVIAQSSHCSFHSQNNTALIHNSSNVLRKQDKNKNNTFWPWQWLYQAVNYGGQSTSRSLARRRCRYPLLTWGDRKWTTGRFGMRTFYRFVGPVDDAGIKTRRTANLNSRIASLVHNPVLFGIAIAV